MIGDPIATLLPAFASFLSNLTREPAETEAEIAAEVHWRPHIVERRTLRGWYLHIGEPEGDSWIRRILRAREVEPLLKIGIAAPIELLRVEPFLEQCDELEATIVVLRSRRDGWEPQAIFASVTDFVCQQRLSLSANFAGRMLDRGLKRALIKKNDKLDGVLLELVVALLLSQVNGFEVTSIGIANRSQQMDVSVHNRNVAGALSQSPLVLAEAKNWKNAVTPTEYAEFLRKLESRHGRAKLGYLVTTSRFTAGVFTERNRESKQDILVVLVDGKALPLLWRGDSTITDAVERLR